LKRESSGIIGKNDLQKEKKIENRKNNQSEFDGSEEQLTDCPTPVIVIVVVLGGIRVKRRRRIGIGSERGDSRRRRGLGCCHISIDEMMRKKRKKRIGDASRSHWNPSCPWLCEWNLSDIPSFHRKPVSRCCPFL
jgi:hypothetical protein